MKFTRQFTAFLILCFLTSACITKKEPIINRDSGILTIMLGKDTTAIQRFEINGDSFRTKVIFKPNGISLIEGSGVFTSDGNLKSMTSKAYKVSATGELLPNQETTITTTQDSTFIKVEEGGLASRTKYSGACIVANDGGIISFYLFPYWGFYSPKDVNDSLVGNQLSGPTGGKRKFVIRRTSENSLQVGSSLMGSVTLNLDKENKLVSIDGTGSSLNITGSVVRNVDFDSLTLAQIDQQMKYGIMPPRTTRDTLVYKNGKLELTINYWQPSVRNRKIFGSVVPWNRFWRAGANNATEIMLNTPLYFKGQKLDSGKYTVFVLPKESPDQWTLMFNKKTGIWGTDYESSYDILRVPMKTEVLPTLVEKLLFSVEPTQTGGAIKIEWENTKASVDFSLKL